MQGLADGYFILPRTLSDYLARGGLEQIDTTHSECERTRAQAKERLDRLMSGSGRRTVDSFHRELGGIMWEHCGMSRNARGLAEAVTRIAELRGRYWAEVKLPGGASELNQSLERAGRVADFFELAELMCRDALDREESCGGHFRVEHQTEEGEARRDDENQAFVAAWVWESDGVPQTKIEEPLVFENVTPSQRSYK
jgi:succinate dehydrogenase / fumarate reductase flavoprotein subunit